MTKAVCGWTLFDYRNNLTSFGYDYVNDRTSLFIYRENHNLT